MRTERSGGRAAVLDRPGRLRVGLALLVGSLAGCQGLPPAQSRGQLVVELAEAPSPSSRSVLYLEAEPARPMDPRTARIVEVASDGALFHPPLTAVGAGDLVRFANRGALTHRLFITDREGRRERLVAPGHRSETLRLARAGEHRFYCSLHPRESFALFAAPSLHFVVLHSERVHRLGDIPSGSYRMRRWSEAGTESLGVIEILPGQTVSRAVTLGSAPISER